MTISAHLLERAYRLIDAGQLQNAESVLEAVVKIDPKNVMAWKAYLQICQDYADLEWVMERISKVAELCENDKADIRAFQNFLIQSMSKRSLNTEDTIPTRTYQVPMPAQEDAIIFELIEEFDFPARKVERAKRRKSRAIFKPNIPMYVWQGFALLAVFTAGIRLLVLGYLFGFLLMGLFIVGGVYWLRNLNIHKVAAPIDATHAYALESENELYIIDKPSTGIKTEKKKVPSPNIRYLDE